LTATARKLWTRYLSDPNEIELAPGALEGLRALAEAGFELVLVTHQSGIARGFFDKATSRSIHEPLQSILKKNGLRAVRKAGSPE
jgi:histidinol phosphatase-like enzyme